MRRRSSLVVAAGLLVAACGGLPLRGEPEAVEGMPGPGSYLVTTEPAAAFEGRSVALILHGETVIRSADLLRGGPPEDTFGASLRTIGGRRYVEGLTVAWPDTTLEASVDGARCEGTIVFTEDDEVDATIVIDQDGCELRLDRRHDMGALAHPPAVEPAD